MKANNRIIGLMTSLVIICSSFAGCNANNSENSKPDESNTETIVVTEATEKISGKIGVFSLVDIETLGANPNMSIRTSKVKDSTYYEHIDYVKLKDKKTSGYKAGDKVDVIIKFNNNVDLTELSLDDCVIDTKTNICTYCFSVSSTVGDYISGAEFDKANTDLDELCNSYATKIANKLPGGTWGNNKTIQRVKGYKLVNSYCAINNKVNADDSVNIGLEVSRLGKAVNGILREYAYDIEYTDGTTGTICTMLILPNIYKMPSGSFKLVDSSSIYNVGSFKIGEESTVLGQFGNMTITDIASASVNVMPDNNAENIDTTELETLNDSSSES